MNMEYIYVEYIKYIPNEVSYLFFRTTFFQQKQSNLQASSIFECTQ